MNGLAICAGVGGIELGLRLVLGEQYRCALYLEREAYAVEILYRRMQEGWLDEAPVHPDVQTFDGRSWRGKIDIITSGFPCQPWSVAGQRKGFDDERWIWPDIARIVGDIRPRFVFIENVPALASGGGLWAVLESLAALGFDARWDSFRASDVGAPHRRERIFILAHTSGINGSGQTRGQWKTKNRRSGSSVEIPAWPPGPTELDRWAEVLAIDPSVEPAMAIPRGGRKQNKPTSHDGEDRRRRRTCSSITRAAGDGRNPDGYDKETSQSPLRRVAHGIPARVDRLRALGNAVVPAVAALAWTELTRRMNGG